MRHKYLISKDENNNKLTIKESAELDKGIFSELFETHYPVAELDAVKTDAAALLSVIRTPCFYPTSLCAEKLADAVQVFLQSDGDDTIEVAFDDMETLVREREQTDMADDDDADVEIDDLLDDEIDDDDFLEDDDISISSSSTPSLRVADDDDGLDDDDK